MYINIYTYVHIYMYISTYICICTQQKKNYMYMYTTKKIIQKKNSYIPRPAYRHRPLTANPSY